MGNCCAPQSSYGKGPITHPRDQAPSGPETLPVLSVAALKPQTRPDVPQKLNNFPDDSSVLQAEREGKQTPLQVTMCRYECGKLVKTMVEEGEYVAVSHVWGVAEWQHIPGVGEVLVSDK